VKDSGVVRRKESLMLSHHYSHNNKKRTTTEKKFKQLRNMSSHFYICSWDQMLPSLEIRRSSSLKLRLNVESRHGYADV